MTTQEQELTLEERIDRMERAVIQMAEIVDTRFGEFAQVIERASRVLKRVEEEGPMAALMGGGMRRRRRGKQADE